MCLATKEFLIEQVKEAANEQTNMGENAHKTLLIGFQRSLETNVYNKMTVNRFNAPANRQWKRFSVVRVFASERHSGTKETQWNQFVCRVVWARFD